MAAIKQNNTTQRSAQPKQRTVDTALQSAAQEIGKTAAGGIVSRLDGLSLREREELMERLAEIMGVDLETFAALLRNRSEESAE